MAVRGIATITPDTAAFAAEDSGSRAQQRGQRIIRGTITCSTAVIAGGDTCDLSNYFPAGKYRVILNPISTTGVLLGVYDHTNKRIQVFSSLGGEATGDEHLNGIFSFAAIGE